MAVERPTNALERVADGQGTVLLRKVSDEEKDLPNVPDGPHELQSLPIEGESSANRPFHLAEMTAFPGPHRPVRPVSVCG